MAPIRPNVLHVDSTGGVGGVDDKIERIVENQKK